MERDKPVVHRSNEDLLRRLTERGLLRTPSVREAMRAVDRTHYAPTNPYQDAPQVIGHSATISAPHMHAHSLELLAERLQPGCRVLDVGCGSGYLCACMARMVGPQGKVVAIDRVPELIELAHRNLSAADGDLLSSGTLEVFQGDGWRGFEAFAPYDAIHVGAAAATVPLALKEQLRPGGRMVIPVGTQSQEFLQIDKRPDGTLKTQTLMAVRYVPLVRPEGLEERPSTTVSAGLSAGTVGVAGAGGTSGADGAVGSAAKDTPVLTTPAGVKTELVAGPQAAPLVLAPPAVVASQPASGREEDVLAAEVTGMTLTPAQSGYDKAL